jgi:NAD(P)-dependent dehydrogenase (short-subunit alcohol dehydrogenase family)
MQPFAGKVVMITGAKGGLGTFVSNAFLDSGATVIGISKSIKDTDFSHPAFVSMPVDLSNAAATCAMVQSAAGRFGTIDVLAHVAGGFAGGKTVEETGDSTWDRMLALNLRPALNMLRSVLPHMKQAGRGRIVVIGGRAALDPQPSIGAYSAAKAALVSLVRTVALENKTTGITANTILPGTMDTDANRAADPTADRSRWISPAKVAEMVLFLASDAAAQITGAAIPIYGAEA